MSAATMREAIISEMRAVQPDAPGRTYVPPAGQGWVVPTGATYAHNKALAEAIANAVHGAGALLRPVYQRWDASSALPAGPETGTRYLCTVSGNGWTADHIYEYNGSTWDDTTPESGMLLLVEDEGTLYVYTGAAWDGIGDGGMAAHALVGTDHTASGLTTGHFLKATGATTFAFGAHGLTYTDVGAAASGHNHDGSYAAIGHNHDGVYAAAGHDHSGVYDPAGTGHSEASAHVSTHESSYSHALLHAQSHTLTGTDHTESDLTAGYFLKATGKTTFAFAAHGLTYSDVGAAASAHDHSGVYDPAGTGHSEASAHVSTHESSYSHALLHAQSHTINGADHTASGLTTGHFLKATGATTFGFAAHGLTYSDVGAQAASATLGAIAALAVTDSNIIVGDGSTWVAETGSTARTSLGLGTSSAVRFARMGLGAAADATAILYATTSDSTAPAAWLNQSSTGDAYVRLSLAGTISYAFGIDNSAFDALVISTAASGTATPGTGNILSLSSSGILKIDHIAELTGSHKCVFDNAVTVSGLLQSQHLGVNTAPAAWDYTDAAFGSSHAVYLGHYYPSVGFNVYANGGTKYGVGSSGNYAAQIYGDTVNGGIVILTSAATGNADAACSLSSRVTIAADGKVSIGAVAADCLLHVWSASAGSVAAPTNTVICAEAGGDAYASVLMPDSSEGGLIVKPVNGDGGKLSYDDSDSAWHCSIDDYADILKVEYANFTVRVNNSGRIMAGGANGLKLYNDDATGITIGDGATGDVTITSGMNLKLGVASITGITGTTPTIKLAVKNSAGATCYLLATSTST